MKEPDHPGLEEKAEELIKHGRFPAARSLCKKLCEADPGKAKSWLLFAKACQETASFEEALDYSQRALSIQPQLPQAHIVMGHAYLGQHKLALAFESFLSASRLSPRNADAYLGMGATYHSDNYFHEALECYLKAAEYNPESLPAHYNSGLIYSLLGQFEDALASLLKARAINPVHPDPLIAMAGVYEKQGQYDAAAKLLKTLIGQGVVSVQAGVVYSRICGHVNQCRNAIHYLETIDKTRTLDKNEQVNLHFALGKLYENSGNYDAAFDHYRKGNDAHGSNYNPHADSLYFDTLISVCDRELMASAPEPETHSGLPVFIIGMPRSGTSLVENILASHPEVSGGGEMRTIINMTDTLGNAPGSTKPYPACLRALSPGKVEELVQRYLSSLREISSSALRVTDKMPHNFLHLPLIRILFPTAPIIHCTRNPLDTCLSCYFQSFAGNAIPYSYDLSFIGQHYRHYQRLMTHWKKNLGISMLDVNYETLVENQEETSRKIISYCGLEWSDSCLQFHKAKHITRTASYDQVRKPLYSTSVNRWKHFEKHLRPLKIALGIID